MALVEQPPLTLSYRNTFWLRLGRLLRFRLLIVGLLVLVFCMFERGLLVAVFLKMHSNQPTEHNTEERKNIASCKS